MVAVAAPAAAVLPLSFSARDELKVDGVELIQKEHFCNLCGSLIRLRLDYGSPPRADSFVSELKVNLDKLRWMVLMRAARADLE